MKHILNISRHDDVDVFVDGKLALEIGSTSNDETVNLFLYSDFYTKTPEELYERSKCFAEILFDQGR